MAQRTGAMKLSKLREMMAAVPVGGTKGKGIDALIVTMQDQHESEYLRDRDKRIRFISGFSGSSATAVITPSKALFWTSGRYYIQALDQLDPAEEWILMKEGLLDTPTKETWLLNNLSPKSIVGTDPNLICNSEWEYLSSTLNSGGHSIVPLSENLIDKVWGDEQPTDETYIINSHPIQFSGKSAGEKVQLTREAMESVGATILVITALDDIAYLLNLRGSDIPCNPVFFAYVILTLEELHLFINASKLSEAAQQQLVAEKVNPVYHPYKDIYKVLNQIASSCTEKDKIWLSSNSSYAIHRECEKAKKHVAMLPVCFMKAVKNQVEIDGMKSSHTRDSVALVKYFAWLEDKIKSGEYITEISGAAQLEKFRSEQDHYIGLSFPTISSVGAHGAIIHYIPTSATDVQITDKEVYLCDSGAQYLDGTTDVTRTMHFGEPSNFEKETFTRVFKGQYQLSTAIFPNKMKGCLLDTLARSHLWKVGLNYLHGTGHGVGSYLCVHEIVSGISWQLYPNDPGVQAGMFLSNEPGYYEDEKFGIRLENVELVVKANTPYNYLGQDYLTFETMTLVPIQTKMLDVSLLTEDEIKYLNDYHAKCYKTLAPFLQGPKNAQALQWLKKETTQLTSR
ncbi:xaa-Pro aminopeptidase ApepP isoform X2 [Prorops nasuta]